MFDIHIGDFDKSFIIELAMNYKIEVIHDAYQKAIGNKANNIASYMRQILKNTPKNRVNIIKLQENPALKNNISNVEEKNQVIDKKDMKINNTYNSSDITKKSREEIISNFLRGNGCESIENTSSLLIRILNTTLRESGYKELGLV